VGPPSTCRSCRCAAPAAAGGPATAPEPRAAGPVVRLSARRRHVAVRPSAAAGPAWSRS
jgi:hypothetical protein